MRFAHTLGEGGPEIEFLILAVAMLVLGIVFFMQRAVKPVVSVVLVIGAFAFGVGAFAAGGTDSQPPIGEVCEPDSGSNGETTVTIEAPADGETVPADEPYALDIDLQGDSGATSGGHFDVSLDNQLETMTAQPDPEITFPPGEHALRVEYVNSRHEPFDPPIFDTVCVVSE
jgi:hypothetical protein